MTPHLIFCRGGNPRVAKLAISLGFLYGTRSDHAVGKGLRCNGLVDINWKDYDWKAHVAFVEKHRPLLAAVPDVTDWEMLPHTLQRIRQLQPLCDNVVVIPKLHGLICKLPDHVVVGVSVPSKYAGFLPRTSELAGRRLHLLGGSPYKQLELAGLYKRRSLDVFSCDGNGICLPAGLKKYWCDKACNWVRNPNKDYYTLLELSLTNWRKSWERLWGGNVLIQRTVGGGSEGFFDLG